MKRYFFDIVGHQRSELDYGGRVLPTFDEACEAAELMAFDLAVKRADEMIGYKVTVSNPDESSFSQFRLKLHIYRLCRWRRRHDTRR